MTHLISHRGPDSVGFHQNSWVALGFNRLSIIDLGDRANQPMFDESGRYVIVHNGEVYNYLELKKELTTIGYSFGTTSDTEVVLKSFIEWGEKCVDRFCGMYSFLVIDQKERLVYAFRDPFGIKPLYYVETENEYVFVNEIKALMPFVPFKPNLDVIYEYLAFRYTISEETMFRNIYRVQPGCFAYFKNNESLKIKNYYEYPGICTNGKFSGNEETEINNIEAILRKSAEIHTRSDVEYGVQLSGGVDSSVITQFVSNMSNKDLRTFSVSFPGTSCDESIYQKEVSNKLNTIHHDLPLSESLFISNIEKCLWHFDFPLHDPNNIAFYLLCKLAKDHGIKVLLSGDGADELFHGYSRYIGLRNSGKKLHFKLRQFYADSKVPKYILENVKRESIPRKLYITHPIIHLCTMNDPYLVYLLIPDLPITCKRRNDLYLKYKKSPEAAITILDFYGYLKPWLTRADRMAMQASVELRVPFCNVQLLEALNRLSFSIKLKENKPKYLLKKITQKYFSKNLVWRRKMGFGLPIDEWFRNKKGLGSYLELLTDKTTRERGLFNFKIIERIIHEHKRKEYNHSRLLWNTLNLELWYRKFIDKSSIYKNMN